MEDLLPLKVVLTFGTLGFVAVFAYLSARATEKLKDDPTHKRSSLCRTRREASQVENAT